jgi:hypothetical protein
MNWRMRFPFIPSCARPWAPRSVRVFIENPAGSSIKHLYNKKTLEFEGLGHSNPEDANYIGTILNTRPLSSTT